MAKATTAAPLPDNNNCPKHPEYNHTCGTCNGLFDKDGNPTPQTQTLKEILQTITASMVDENIMPHNKYEDAVTDEDIVLLGEQLIDDALAQINATMIPRTEHERELVRARLDQTFKVIQSLVKSGAISDEAASSTLAIHTAALTLEETS